MPKIIIFSELSEGGISDYAHDQANALAALGREVEMLCAPKFIEGRKAVYRTYPVLKELRVAKQSHARVVRRTRLGLGIIKNISLLYDHLKRNPGSDVILHFSEYLAPLWAWRLRHLARDGIRFYTILHDPSRDYRVGPRWWHELSVREAFSFVTTVFVHTRDRVMVPSSADVVWIPYGVHSFPIATRSRVEVRKDLNIPVAAKLLAAFGYIRDNKNLDLVLRALSSFSEVYLVVAGTEQAGGNKPIEYYRKLANSLGCAGRCRWLIRFLGPEETANLLCASDLSMLTYTRSFVSSSAALGVAANYQLPSLISGGSRTTEELVRQHGIGIWVEPDSVDAIKAGLETWLESGISPNWESYNRENSWAKNAELVDQALSAARLAG